jgi:hypothetical protein
LVQGSVSIIRASSPPELQTMAAPATSSNPRRCSAAALLADIVWSRLLTGLFAALRPDRLPRGRR